MKMRPNRIITLIAAITLKDRPRFFRVKLALPMPTRKIPKNACNVTGVKSSKKSIGLAECESTLEYDFLTKVEFDSNVKSFEVQPIEITYVCELGKSRKYTPDVLIHFVRPTPNTNGKLTWLCEVKSRRWIFENLKEFKPRWKAAIRLCNNKSWKFHLVSENEIRTPYLFNAKFLQPYKESVINVELTRSVSKKIDELRVSTPAALIQSCASSRENQGRALTTLWSLIASGYIGCDLNQKLTMNSTIWSLEPHEERKYPCLLD
jgi:hypothetical protein